MEQSLVGRIYKRYAKEIYFYLLSLSHDAYLSEDILQEVFLKAICSLPDSHTNIRAWLYRVAKNTYLNETKKRDRDTALNETDSDGGEDLFTNSILQSILQSETEKMLYQNIMRLPKRQQKILILQYFSGLSIKEIAASMGISLENVRVLSHRGRKQLKTYMEEDGYEIL